VKQWRDTLGHVQSKLPGQIKIGSACELSVGLSAAANGKIVQDLPLNEFSRDKIEKSVAELREEKIAHKRSAVAAVYDRRRRSQSAATGTSDFALRFLSPAGSCNAALAESEARLSNARAPRQSVSDQGSEGKLTIIEHYHQHSAPNSGSIHGRGEVPSLATGKICLARLKNVVATGPRCSHRFAAGRIRPVCGPMAGPPKRCFSHEQDGPPAFAKASACQAGPWLQRWLQAATVLFKPLWNPVP